MTCAKKPYRRQKPDGAVVLVVTCCDCSKEVEVPTKAVRRLRCNGCHNKKEVKRSRDARQRRKGKPLLPRPSGLAQTLGPSRPAQGMTRQALEDWRRSRVVALYRDEELSVAAIAERLGYSEKGVQEVLVSVGIRTWGDGRRSLPLGLPG